MNVTLWWGILLVVVNVGVIISYKGRELPSVFAAVGGLCGVAMIVLSIFK